MVFKTAISAGRKFKKQTPSARRRNSDEDADQEVISDEEPPPFLPLEEAEDVVLMSQSDSDDWMERASQTVRDRGKPVVAATAAGLFLLVAWDTFVREPESRWIRPQAFSQSFLLWVQSRPVSGIVAILLVIATAVVFMIPIGTPLTVGCGYIYKGAFGWKLGLTIATIVSMGGSALGAVTCFLLGRYLMRDQVRKWIRKYPLFDAIDVAAAEHGLRIMAMLYLTPVLPLGPVSYMCGTTSMALSSFVLAKIASLPLMLLYAFIGASTGALLSKKGGEEEMHKIEENQTLIVAGIALSFVTIATITHYIKKELNTILERQKKHKPGETEQAGEEAMEEAALEMGATGARQRRNV